MAHFHAPEVVARAVLELRSGSTPRRVANELGVPRNTVERWRRVYVVEGLARGQSHCQVPCPVCQGEKLDEEGYSELLGWYLGDGHIVKARRGVWKLSIYNDAQYVADNERLLEVMARIKPGGRPMSVVRGHMVATYMYWKHWPCLFPQHGPGRKHERRLDMADWQWQVIEAHPAAFLRGLFHSDGSRVHNWASKMVAGKRKRYDYPRWQFTNESAEIMLWCQVALNLVGIDYRQTTRRTLSVSRRQAVARLDELIGLKS